MHETCYNINIYYIVINGTLNVDAYEECGTKTLENLIQKSNIFSPFPLINETDRMKVLFSICFDDREPKKKSVWFFIHFRAFALSIKVCLLFIPNAEHDYYFLIILNEENYYYCRCRFFGCGCWNDCFPVDVWYLRLLRLLQMNKNASTVDVRRLNRNFCIAWFSIHSVQLNELNMM